MSSDTGTCEGCSATFSIFKRKKPCNICKQDFCQSCLTRQPNRNIQSLNGTKDRICITCQNLSSNSTSIDEIMKCKTKHLRLFLQAKNIQTNTCKEKRELVDLILRFNRNNAPPQQPSPRNSQHAPPRNPPPPPPPPPQQQQQPNNNFYNSNQQQPNNNFQNSTQQQQQQSRTIGDTINSFVSNVQDFVNYNVNAAMNDGGNTGYNVTSTVNGRTRSSGSSNSNNNQQQQQAPNLNMNHLFSYINEQIPPIIQQNFTNNLFTFNNNVPPTTSTTTNNNNHTNHQQQTASARTNDDENNPPPPPQQQPATSNSNENNSNIKRRASISDLNNENDIENLTVRQMKEILASNFVDFKGVCERSELIERVKILFESHVKNKRLVDQINNEAAGGTAANNDENAKSSGQDDLCKICMDALVDCVLLDCGHMISCTKCGKRLAECPMCRKNIIKVVRVFKS